MEGGRTGQTFDPSNKERKSLAGRKSTMPERNTPFTDFTHQELYQCEFHLETAHLSFLPVLISLFSSWQPPLNSYSVFSISQTFLMLPLGINSAFTIRFSGFFPSSSSSRVLSNASARPRMFPEMELKAGIVKLQNNSLSYPHNWISPGTRIPRPVNC